MLRFGKHLHQQLCMKNNMLINEIFKSLQGEGQFAGHPMLFIRLSKCTRKCSWCDTKYHTKVNQQLSPKELAKIILKSKVKDVCFTGGEPLLQLNEMINTIELVNGKVNFHLESNGDLVTKDNVEIIYHFFDYLAFSPKELKVAKKLHSIFKGSLGVEIKVVTDMKTTGVEMLKYATMLMPLTTYNEAKDKKIMQKVWEYCSENNKLFTARLQYLVYGKKMSV